MSGEILGPDGRPTPGFGHLSATYQHVDDLVGSLSVYELMVLAGAIVGALVDCGYDSETAVAMVKEAADGGGIGSRMVDEHE